jgi:hypothetical protein
MKKKILFVFIILLALCGLVLTYFLFFRKGSAGTPLPTPAGEATGTTLPGDQKLKTFSENGFSVSYPDWPILDSQYLLEPAKIAVNNEGCSFVLTTKKLPSGTDFESYIDKNVTEQLKQVTGKTIKKEIGDKTSFIEGQYTVSNVTLHSYSRGYLIGKDNLYSFAFIATEDTFNRVCKPLIESVLESVTIE